MISVPARTAKRLVERRFTGACWALISRCVTIAANTRPVVQFPRGLNILSVFANLFFGKVLGYTPWTTGNDQNAFCVYPPESARDGGHVVHTSIVTVRLNDLFDKLNIDPRKYRLRVKIAEAKKAAELGFTLDPAGEAHVLTGLARMPRSKILARTFSKLAQRTGEHIRNLVGRDNSARPAKARPFNRRRQPTF